MYLNVKGTLISSPPDRAKSDSSIISKISTRNVGDLTKDCCDRPPPELTVFYVNHKETKKKHEPAESKRNNTKPENETEYITKEKYEYLNRDLSSTSIVKSTSTIFYDLDEIAKKQSLTYFVEPLLDEEIGKSKEKLANQRFGQPCAIVQECETYKGPILIPRDSAEIIAKKGKRKGQNNVYPSKNDNIKECKNSKDSKRCFNRELTDQQKFWSYAKYRTDYPTIPEEIKPRRKDRGKRGTTDPCPCQLFSYACPCEDSNNKSLTGLLNQIHSTENHQTSTADIPSVEKQRIINQVKECKLTNTSFVGANKETILLHSKTDKQFKNTNENMSVGNTQMTFKKTRKITCPRCKEAIEVISSTEDIYQKQTFSPNPPTYQKVNVQRSPMTIRYEKPSVTKTLPKPEFRKQSCSPNVPVKESRKQSYSPNVPEKESQKQSYSPNVPEKISPTDESKNDDDEYCTHDPPCEMIPVCQVLPPEHSAKKYAKSLPPRTGPRIIRITKACRHHPPCTVVPSCQRAYVLKNNCEFVPPCMHRPRCVNLPLCVPISKQFNLDSLTTKQEETSNEPQRSTNAQRGMNNGSPQDLLNSNEVNRQCCDVLQVQNTCEHGTRYVQQILQTPHNPTSPNTICAQYHLTAPTFNVKHSKSVGCQYVVRESESDAVVFIRDVGCQFRNKRCCPKDSLARLLTPSVSFELMNVNMGNYYTGFHTLRYEDKCTSPASDMSLYESSSDSDSSRELSPCASPRLRQDFPRCTRVTGFLPRLPTYVAAFSTCQVTNSCPRKQSIDLKEKTQAKDIPLHEMNPIKSKKSIFHRTLSKYKQSVKSHRRCKHSCPVNTHVGAGSAVVDSASGACCFWGPGSPGMGTTGPIGPNCMPGYVDIPSTGMDGLGFVVL
ncbi:hypothetical protein NE865_10169 [Phthorimaea operculella]|nr:hypothetical protein NE865_10169 [Phthorimaea operculella]